MVESTITAAVKIANTQSEKEEVYSFRYQIYVEEMGKKISQANHAAKIIRDELDDWGTLFYACDQEGVVATLLVNIGTQQDFGPYFNKILSMDKFQYMSPNQPILSLSSRLMIRPGFRGSQILYHLLAKAYELGRSLNVQFNFCYCAPSLVSLYEQLGYRRYTDNFTDQDTGYRIPLVLIPEDVEHFRTIRSPFYRLARTKVNSTEASLWFMTAFPSAQLFINRHLYTEQDFWKILNDRLSEPPEKKIKLLEGLSQEESQKALQSTPILRSKKGDSILRSGDVGDEMFVVLTGAVEVSKLQSDNRYVIAILGPGEIFGEMAFVTKAERSADVIALTDSDIIVFSRSVFERLNKHIPDISSRLLLNLCAILCERVGTTTNNWINSLVTIQST